MDFSRPRGWIQLTGFIVQSSILCMDLTSTMVLIHQLLFVFRLLTSGPTGFENAASFYLHKDMIFWRHYSVKVLGLSLALFLVSAGFMLFVLFDEAGYPEPKFKDKKLIPAAHTAVGVVVLVLFFLQAALLFFVRSRHIAVFQRQYQRGSIAPLNLNGLQDPTF